MLFMLLCVSADFNVCLLPVPDIHEHIRTCLYTYYSDITHQYLHKNKSHFPPELILTNATSFNTTYSITKYDSIQYYCDDPGT